MDAAAFAKAWNADISAAAAGAAQVEPPGTSELIPVGELVVVPLKAGQAPSTAYDALKGVLKGLRHEPAEALLSAAPTGDGDLVAVIRPVPPPPAGFFSAALTFLCWLSRITSIATWTRLYKKEKGIHYYVLFWLALLIFLLIVSPTTGTDRFAIVVIIFYRLQDLIFSTLDNALNLTKRAWHAIDFSWQTPVMLALVNIVQIVLIFAIAYLMLTGQNPAAFSHPPTGRFGEFFLSWISLPPLGGGATPLSTMARTLTISEEASGLLMIVISISRFLASPG
ncbi:MAG: hypothetical protein ACLQDY_30050 [Streptosporangiaceae bacterium]